MKKCHSQFSLAIIALFASHFPAQADSDSGTPGLYSIETEYTITKVRTAHADEGNYIVASSYEGVLMGIGYDGSLLWKNELSGFMNHDLWCEDITGDGMDEVMAANADGTLYCLDGKGKLQWQFRKNDAPMYTVCVVQKDNVAYVVCGSFDKKIYYLSPSGTMIKEIHSNTYSHEKPSGGGLLPPENQHTANFVRRMHQSDGSDILVVHGVAHSMRTSGFIYLFKPLAELPYSTIAVESRRPIGEVRVAYVDSDGSPEILMGTSTMIHDALFIQFDPESGERKEVRIQEMQEEIDRFGYRVVQPEIIPVIDGYQYFILFGSRILLLPPGLETSGAEILACKYSFNDMWKDPENNKIILASSQSGGSCVHVLNPGNPDWKNAYINLLPPGKINAILKNTKITRDNLKAYKRPSGEREPLPVYLLSESTRNSVRDLVNDIKSNYSSPLFFESRFTSGAENWDRSSMESEKYRKRRDQRRSYTLTSEQAVDRLTPRDENSPGIAFWGGHGNDPYMFSKATQMKFVNAASGKKLVMIYPELEDHHKEFEFVLNDLLYPLAEYCQGKNAKLYLRNKHTFWQSTVYSPMWSRLVSGEFADVCVPAMEETTDKSMELSVASRMGIWTSGAVDSWGARCARDNTSFDRLRQHSHQMLPNHFLRQMVYNISNGSRYIDNFPVNQEYMSLLWMLIAKGALYVPERSEIVSFSPVHLSMTEPDDHYLNEGNNTKWTTFYNEAVEENNQFVFSHLNGTWPGAPLTEWDFSRYAAGAKERRLNFLPSYENGLVLITPPQNGAFAADNQPRGKLTDHLHPMYKSIMKEYISNGRSYYSADGNQQYPADEYYKTIEAEIQNSASLLPLTVTGDVAWVVAQTSPTHLRLTIIDGGYINPNQRTAKVSFHTVVPIGMVDILDGEEFDITNPSSVTVEVPCGMFRFIDVEIKNPL